MRILLIGGAGFIGSALCNHYKNGNHILVVDNFSIGRLNRLLAGTDVIVADSRNFYFGDLERFDLVFFMPALCNSKDFVKYPFSSYDSGVTSLLNFLNTYPYIGDIKLVVFSSSEVYGNTECNDAKNNFSVIFNDRLGYDFGKLSLEVISELYSREYGLDYIVVRPFNVYGEYEYRDGVITKFIKQALSKLPLTIYGDGSQKRCFMYIDDFIRAIDILINNWKPGTYNIGNPDEPISILELANKINVMCGNDKINTLPYPFDDIEERVPIIDKIIKLGFKPQVNLNNGLERVIDWAKNEDFEVARLTD